MTHPLHPLFRLSIVLTRGGTGDLDLTPGDKEGVVDVRVAWGGSAFTDTNLLQGLVCGGGGRVSHRLRVGCPPGRGLAVAPQDVTATALSGVSVCFAGVCACRGWEGVMPVTSLRDCLCWLCYICLPSCVVGWSVGRSVGWWHVARCFP